MSVHYYHNDLIAWPQDEIQTLHNAVTLGKRKAENQKIWFFSVGLYMEYIYSTVRPS